MRRRNRRLGPVPLEPAELLHRSEPLGILSQVESNGGWVALSEGTGLGMAHDRDFVRQFEVD